MPVLVARGSNLPTFPFNAAFSRTVCNNLIRVCSMVKHLRFVADVKQYDNLIRTLRVLLMRGQMIEKGRMTVEAVQLTDLPMSSSAALEDKPPNSSRARVAGVVDPETIPRPYFLMSWRRRIPKEDESKFFEGCRTAGLFVKDVGPRIYCITAQSW